MDSLLSRSATLFREDGPRELVRQSVRFCYDNILRPRLPRSVVEYNHVKVYGARLGDSLLPWYTTDNPSYEDALVSGIRRYVESGDTVVVVGGGWGVTTVVAAQQSGDDGHVITYEGAESEIAKIEETIRLNDIADRVTARHTVVAEAHALRGNMGDASIVPPDELPDCDVLVLDCEGAESAILREMAIQPQVVLVETHGMHGTPRKTIRNLLEDIGYEVANRGVAESHQREFCIDNDIYVLSGVRDT